MRVGFIIDNWGRRKPSVALRELHRLYCWAAVAINEGHDVDLYVDQREPLMERLLQKFQVPASKQSDIYIKLASAPSWLCRNARPIACVQPAGVLELTDAAFSADVVVGSPNDTLPAYQKFARERIEALGDRYIGVHWGPSVRVFTRIIEDGMFDAFVSDDLEALRVKYASRVKDKPIGFLGFNSNARLESLGGAGRHPSRKETFNYYHGRDGFDIRTTYTEKGGHHNLSVVDYLRFVSECKLTIPLIGDRIKCHRHAEATMMGSPLCVVKDELDVTPPHSDDNSVMMCSWFDHESALAGLDRADELVAKSDEAYRVGWGWPAQFRMILERLTA
jgi:hypothetical protein